MKFIKVAKTKKMLQIDIDGKTEWTNASEAVYNYAKDKFQEGNEIELEYNEQNGMKFVTRITKPGQSQSNSSNSSDSNSDKPTCSDCGAVLKDSKYKKCYTCNQKNPAPKKSSYYSKSPEDVEQIKRLSILSSTCNAISTLTGQIDANVIGDVIEALYDRLYEKISK